MNAVHTSTVVAVLWTSLALGASAPSVLFAQNPCDQDSAKICGGVEPGDGRVNACLMTHPDELSKPCREAVKLANDSLPDMRQTCIQDANRFCIQYVNDSRTRLLDCLKNNIANVSAECKAKYDKIRALNYPYNQ